MRSHSQLCDSGFEYKGARKGNGSIHVDKGASGETHGKAEKLDVLLSSGIMEHVSRTDYHEDASVGTVCAEVIDI